MKNLVKFLFTILVVGLVSCQTEDPNIHTSTEIMSGAKLRKISGDGMNFYVSNNKSQDSSIDLFGIVSPYGFHDFEVDSTVVDIVRTYTISDNDTVSYLDEIIPIETFRINKYNPLVVPVNKTYATTVGFVLDTAVVESIDVKIKISNLSDVTTKFFLAPYVGGKPVLNETPLPINEEILINYEYIDYISPYIEVETNNIDDSKMVKYFTLFSNHKLLGHQSFDITAISPNGEEVIFTSTVDVSTSQRYNEWYGFQ